jgi:hypothetical protein
LTGIVVHRFRSGLKAALRMAISSAVRPMSDARYLLTTKPIRHNDIMVEGFTTCFGGIAMI